MVVDFKAGVTIPHHLASRLQLRTYNIKSATRAQTELCVVATFSLLLDSWSGNHSFVISTQLKDRDVILGRDFLKASGVVIDHGSDVITIRRHVTATCVVAEPIVVPPQSQSIVYCTTDETMINTLAIFEPSVHEELILGHSIAIVNESLQVPVSVLNLHPHPIHLAAKSILGEVSVDSFELTDYGIQSESIATIEATVAAVDSVRGPVIDWNRIKVGKCLSDQQICQLKVILEKHIRAFQWDDDDVGLTSLIEHKIDTGSAEPIRQRQFRLPQSCLDEVGSQIQDMLRRDQIEESTAPWCSQMLIVKQVTRDGTVKYRFVLDLRKLNDVTVKDSYPLPRIDATLDALGGAKFFSVIDMARGYFQVPIAEVDRCKTAFMANNKLYQFKVMPLGLANAPSTYSRLMNMVLKGLTWKTCLVYLDDTIIFSKSFEDHLVHLEEVLTRIVNANLKLRPDKCTFAADDVHYLGYVITPYGIKPDPNKVSSIVSLPFPKTPRELVRFLGATRFYQMFIHDFSDIAYPLYKAAQSLSKFRRLSALQSTRDAFELLKTKLSTSPVLAYPDFSKDFVVQCDASIKAVGAVIGQLNNNQFQPVSYASRHLTKTETRYTTTERELLAITYAAHKFRPYLYGRSCTFVTDHKPLATLKELHDPLGRIGRLFSHLKDMNYKIVYQPGAENVTADMLSRDTVEANSLVLSSTVNWSVEQSMDPVLRLIEELLSSGTPWADQMARNPELLAWNRVRSQLCIRDGVLYRISLGSTGEKSQIVVPSHLVPLVLKLSHDIPLAGHRGFDKTLETVSETFYWPSLSVDVKLYCESCHLCQTKKPSNFTPVAPLKPIQVTAPWMLIGIDITGPLKRTSTGNEYVILAIDYFSKFCIAKAIPNATAETSAKFLFDEVVCRFGCPKSIITDHGRNFDAELFRQLCSKLQIQKLNSTFYHPEGNGLVERTIRSIKQIITMYINPVHNNWDEYLQAAISAYNTHTSASTKFSPYEILFARKPIVITDAILKPSVSSSPVPLDAYLRNMHDTSRQLHLRVNSNLEKAHEEQKKFYDRDVNEKYKFLIGDYVLLSNERQKVGESRSFTPKFLGPFVIIDHYNSVNYVIEDLVTRKTQAVHFNRLKPYKMRAGIANRDRQAANLLGSKPEISVNSGAEQRFHLDAGLDLIRIAKLLANKRREVGDQADVESNLDESEQETIYESDAEGGSSDSEGEEAKCGICGKILKNQHGLAVHAARVH